MNKMLFLLNRDLNYETMRRKNPLRQINMVFLACLSVMAAKG